MEAMREAWTDERLDDLSDRMDRDFKRVDVRFDRFEREVERRFDKVDARFDKFEDKVDGRFARLEQRFDSLQRMLLAGYITLIAGLIATQF